MRPPTTLRIGQTQITLHEGTHLAAQTHAIGHCEIDVCKFSDDEYGHYAGANADHLTIARWHVKPIKLPAKSFR